MAIDTPATIAVLGAGPTGLEAALYARFLGYEVDLYERGRVAENVLRWGHVQLFSPFGMNRSTLGLAAIGAQQVGWTPPDNDVSLTAQEWAEQYLLPLAATDLLRPSIHEQTRVISVKRSEETEEEVDADEAENEIDDEFEEYFPPFNILIEDAQGQRTVEADIVIDTSGTFGNHNWLGPMGEPLEGESSDNTSHSKDRIAYGLPDVLGDARDRYAARHTLVVGAGYSAATSIAALAELAQQVPETRITWVTRKEASEDGPMARIEEDTLTQRDALAQRANALATESDGNITHWANTTIERIEASSDDSPLSVTLAGDHAAAIEVDQILANIGFHGDDSLYESLDVPACPATGGPLRLAASLAKEPSADCLAQTSGGVDLLVNPEPNFYILGSKSYGQDSRYLASIGLTQIRDLFGLIGGRAALDLYGDVKGLL